MDRATTEFRKDIVQNLLVSTITKASTRDEQRMLGPSDLSDPCDVCLFANFKNSVSPQGPREVNQAAFSFKAWLGTCVHEKLDREFPLPEDEALTELSVPIWEIPGYGMVKGHVDLTLPNLSTWVDWKTSDLKKIKSYRLNGPPERHIRQKMMYGYGLIKAGYNMKTSVLSYIPRDSNSVSDIWTTAAPYSEDWALESMERAERIWKQVSSGGSIDAESHPDCWPCNRGFLSRIKFG